MEARAALEKTVQNHCPFGCKTADLEDHGYCHHLLGFTNDRDTYEPVNVLYRRMEDGTPYDTGFKITSGKKDCPVDAVYVNPERLQVENGVAHMAKAWVSDRVYLEDVTKVPKLAPPDHKPDEVYAMMARKKELEAKLAKKKLADEIKALESQLAEAEPKAVKEKK